MSLAAVYELGDVLQAAPEQVWQLPGALKHHRSNKKRGASERPFPLAKEFLRKVSARASQICSPAPFLFENV